MRCTIHCYTLYKLNFWISAVGSGVLAHKQECHLLPRDPCFCSFLLHITRNKQLQWHWFCLHS
jgi:hypothetical protein